MTRHIVLLLLLIICLSACARPTALQPSVQEEKAVQTIEALGGNVKWDDKISGRPVVEVDLSLSMITDAGLKDLKELKDLQTLDLGHTSITDAGRKDLKRALPRTTIYH